MWTVDQCSDGSAFSAGLVAVVHAAERLNLLDPVQNAFSVCLFLAFLCLSTKSTESFVRQAFGCAIILAVVFSVFAYFMAPDCASQANAEPEGRERRVKRISPLPVNPQVETTQGREASSGQTTIVRLVGT